MKSIILTVKDKLVILRTMSVQLAKHNLYSTATNSERKVTNVIPFLGRNFCSSVPVNREQINSTQNEMSVHVITNQQNTTEKVSL